jgi:hypothetical protein
MCHAFVVRRLGRRQASALKPQLIWMVRFWLARERQVRGRAMFDLAIDFKLRACGVVKVKLG